VKCVDKSTRGLLVPVCVVAVRLAGVSCIAAVAIVIAMGLLVRSADAEIDGALLRLGSDLKNLGESDSEALREVRLNGARLWLRTLHVEAPVARVLNRYEQTCVEANSRVFRALGAAVGGLVSRAADVLGLVATSSRHYVDRGYVACVDFASSDGDRLLDDLGSLSRGEQLNRLGALHYVYVERGVGSMEHGSFVLIVRANFDSLIRGLVPRGGGDAEGRDLPGFPRPRDTKRILSAWEVNGPSGLFSYVTDTQSVTDLESFYRSVLPKEGWKLIGRHPDESIQIDRIRMLAAEKERRLITVIMHPNGEAKTVLTILVSEPS
jgi:hypothetical protein